MQLRDSTNKQGLIEDITFLLGNTVDLNSYPIEDRVRNINIKLGLVWHMIFESYGGWKFIDSGQSDPSDSQSYVDLDITSGTAHIALPDEAITVERVFIKDSANTPLRRLPGLTQEEFFAAGGDGRFVSNGVPECYILQGDVLRMLPTPNYTLSSAVRLYFGQQMTAFAVSDTTATPGFVSIYHRILSVGAALDYALGHKPESVAYLTGLWNYYEGAIRSFYANRYQERNPGRIGPGQDIVQEFR